RSDRAGGGFFMVAKYPYLVFGVTAATITGLSTVGCGAESSSGPGAPGGPGAEIAVSVVPSIRASGDVMASADLVAYQDGDGPWVSATGTGGVYRFAVHDDRYGVAVGCTGYFGGIAIYYQLVSETSDLAVHGCDRSDSTATITVDVQGGGDITEVWIGSWLGFVLSDLPARLVVPRGLTDVFVRSYLVFPGGESDVRVHLGPSIDIQDDQQLSIDMADAVHLETHPLTISDPASLPGTWSTASSYVTPHARQFHTIQGFFDRHISYSMLPASARQPGDLARVEVTESAAISDQTRSSVRGAFQNMATPSAVSLEPPAFLTVSDPSIDLRAVSQLSVTLPILPSKLGYTVSKASFYTSTVVSSSYLEIHVLPGWAQSQPSVSLHVPDLRNLSEWTSDMALKARTEVDWSISVIDQNVPFGAPLADGMRGLTSEVSGKLIPRQNAAGAQPACHQQPCDTAITGGEP
ncbi:MAG: hypothetical protein ACREBE_02815, partial [bacterium]